VSTPQFFPDPDALRARFDDHADEGGELCLGFWKKGTGRLGLRGAGGRQA
jgi:hypothetical protein